MLLLVIFVLFAGALPPSLEQRQCCTEINRRSVIEEMKGLQLLSRNWRFIWRDEMVETPQERKQNKSCDSPREALRSTVMSSLLPALNEGMGNPWFYFYFLFL
jgi:hypothetical protein